MPAATVRQRLITAEELYSPEFAEKCVELIEGEPVEMTPSGWRHGDIVQNVA